MKKSKPYKAALLFIRLIILIISASLAGCNSLRTVNKSRVKVDSTGIKKESLQTFSVIDSTGKTSDKSEAEGLIELLFANDTTEANGVIYNEAPNPYKIAEIAKDGGIIIRSREKLLKATIRGKISHVETDSTGLHKEANSKAENVQETTVKKKEIAKHTESKREVPKGLIIGGCIVVLLLGLFFILRITKNDFKNGRF